MPTSASPISDVVTPAATGTGRASEPNPGSRTPPIAAHHAFGSTDIGLLVMVVIWGVNYSIVKHGLETLAPLTFNSLRISIAALILCVVAATVRDAPHPSRRDLVALLAIGLLGNGAYQLLFILGIAKTRAGIAALVVASGPAWIAIIGRLLGREHVSARSWGGIGLQLLGVACVVVSARGVDAGPSAMFGTALIVGGSICWALYAVLLQPYTAHVHPLHLSALTTSSGAVMMLALAMPGLTALDWGSVTLAAWGTVAYASVGALVIGYLLYYRGIRVLGATRTAMYGNLQPVIALSVAWILLHERPSLWQCFGAALIIAGLLLSRTGPMQRSPELPLPQTLRS